MVWGVISWVYKIFGYFGYFWRSAITIHQLIEEEFEHKLSIVSATNGEMVSEVKFIQKAIRCCTALNSEIIMYGFSLNRSTSHQEY